jgi:hypothetical protein
LTWSLVVHITLVTVTIATAWAPAQTADMGKGIFFRMTRVSVIEVWNERSTDPKWYVEYLITS